MQKAAARAAADYWKISAVFLILKVGSNLVTIGLTGKRNDNQQANRTHSTIPKPIARHHRSSNEVTADELAESLVFSSVFKQVSNNILKQLTTPVTFGTISSIHFSCCTNMMV